MMLIVLSCIVAACLAVPQNYYQQPQYPQYSGKPVVPITSESNELNPDGSFSYSYSTGDGQQAQAQGYLKNAGNKEAEAEVIQGSYSYTAPDGTPITVNWIADENGFRAEGSHIPTPPPVPEAIQRSLQVVPQSRPQQQPFQPQYQSQQFKRPFRF
ncbi:endocuticle structural glycoprotein SgAbd-2-like [Aethina tumida]|uniref:endocuticle structural glycoprotein SgAbd-2-like n=1 Tax=Aethina tumida TaxID=116153 RepID=UPI00096B2421|nr:endocuticle structural glycoprotein SgAbd-2-like [Aethina tumida]